MAHYNSEWRYRGGMRSSGPADSSMLRSRRPRHSNFSSRGRSSFRLSNPADVIISFLNSMHCITSEGLYGARVAIRWLGGSPEFRFGRAMVARILIARSVVRVIRGARFQLFRVVL